MFRAGDQIGPYVLVSKLGRGAFGVVWLAERRTTITTTKVALKMPLDEDIKLEAIRQEANLWVHASGHPNILPIIEADLYDDQVIIVSEYAPDGSLDDWLRQHGGAAPSIEVAVEMTAGILAGLQHLHSRHIIHRDMKPQNILLQGQTPRLADFGISRVLKSTSQSSIVAGTPVYMAPEAFEGKRNEQTDLWSVGVIFYQLLAGHLPFPQDDLASLMGAILKRNPDPLPLSVPMPLQQVLACCLSKDPAQRYKTATEMRAALRTAMEAIQRGGYSPTEPVPPPPYPPPPYPQPPLPAAQPKKSRAKVWASTLGGILLVVLLVASKLATHYWSSIERASSAEPASPASQPAAAENHDAADLRRWLTMLGQSSNVAEVVRQTSMELAGNPLNALARRARCSAYYLSHDEETGKRDAEEAERALANATTAEEYEARCYVRWRLKKADDAFSDCTRAIALDPQYPWARLTRGSIYYEKKDYDRSLADNTKGIELSPSYPLAYSNRGIAHYMKQEYDSAMADFNKAIGLDPQCGLAYDNRGIVHYVRRDYDSAIADFNKAIELDPKSTNARTHRGLTYYVKKDYDSAIADFNKAVELDPKFADAYSGRGIAYAAKQDYGSAIADHNQAIELDADNPSVYINRGNDYYYQRDYDHALADYDRAIQLNPKSAEAYLCRANDYYEQRDYERAIGDYTRAIELDPQYAAAYGNRANAYDAAGDSFHAAADREKAQGLKR